MVVLVLIPVIIAALLVFFIRPRRVRTICLILFMAFIALPTLLIGSMAIFAGRPVSANLYHLLTNDFHHYQDFVIGTGDLLAKTGTLTFHFMPEAAGYYELALLGPEMNEYQEIPEKINGAFALEITDGSKTRTESAAHRYAYTAMYKPDGENENIYRNVISFSTFGVPVSGWRLKPVNLSLKIKEPLVLDSPEKWTLALKFRVVI